MNKTQIQVCYQGVDLDEQGCGSPTEDLIFILQTLKKFEQSIVDVKIIDIQVSYVTYTSVDEILQKIKEMKQ